MYVYRKKNGKGTHARRDPCLETKKGTYSLSFVPLGNGRSRSRVDSLMLGQIIYIPLACFYVHLTVALWYDAHNLERR